MGSVPACCPFCNAELPALPAAPPTHLPCPRCGEPVAGDRFPIHEHASSVPNLTFANADTVSVTERKSRTLRTVVAFMSGRAALALVFALLTQSIRRERDPKPKPEIAEELAQRPAELLALGYLPRQTNLALGLHLAALAREPAGRELLREPRPPVLDLAAQVLELAGLAVADVDHVVAGTELKTVNFHLTTVIVTRVPYSPEHVKQAAAKHKVHETHFRGAPLYQFGELPRVPKLWCAAPRVLVYTTLPMAELARIPESVQEPAATLTPAARAALADRLSKPCRVWLVGDLAPAKELLDALPLFAGPYAEPVRMLAKVRSFALGLALPESGGVAILGDFHTGSPAATQEVRTYLNRAELSGAKSHKVEAPPPDIEAPEAQWVTWQVRADPDAVRSALDNLPFLSRPDRALAK